MIDIAWAEPTVFKSSAVQYSSSSSSFKSSFYILAPVIHGKSQIFTAFVTCLSRKEFWIALMSHCFITFFSWVLWNTRHLAQHNC